MLMPEYLAAHWEHSSDLQRHTKYQCKKHSNSPIPAFSEGVKGEKDFKGMTRERVFLQAGCAIQSLNCCIHNSFSLGKGNQH